jgi:penicillin G amidase
MRNTVIISSCALLVGLAGLGAGLWFARDSLPEDRRQVALHGLKRSVRVEFDYLAVPRILARSRNDALRALGYVTARERMFQMDLLRRRAAGRLAEVLGRQALAEDRRHRSFGFSTVARSIAQSLPVDQRTALVAYADGVNGALRDFRTLPWEFLLLGYKPEPWRSEDSLLILLGMYEELSFSEEQERSASILEAALAPEVARFFTPSNDPETSALAPGARPPPPLPFAALAELAASAPVSTSARWSPGRLELKLGSNAWVVGPERSRDGRALLANDMHLGLAAPNLWYRAELRYGEVFLGGVTLPGLPLVVAGSNGHVAWGLTGSGIDSVDLVTLDESGLSDAYHSAGGSRAFELQREQIAIRDEPPQEHIVQHTSWGPVAEQRLRGKRVALHWSALDPSATDLTLLELDGVRTAAEAVSLFNRSGGPILNALVADRAGHIAWTLMGRVPIRFGFSGESSRPWLDDGVGWRGYVAPDELPRRIDPAEGWIVNANQRMVGFEASEVVGHDYAAGQRASRITKRLSARSDWTEASLLDVQLDTDASFYRYYQQLALKVLDRRDDRAARSIREQLKRWDGRAEPQDTVLPLLVEFRAALLEELLAAAVARCRAIEPAFQWTQPYPDVPVQRMLDAGRRELIPGAARGATFEQAVAEILLRSARRLGGAAGAEGASWGDFNPPHIVHPLSGALGPLGSLLDLSERPQPGCPECVRAFAGDSGASERLVVSPGHESDGILHMPGGQSGHPLSPHYRDQHESWALGLRRPLLVSETRTWLELVPPEGDECSSVP